MSIASAKPAPTDVLAEIRENDLHSVERMLSAIPDPRVRRAVQDWMVARLEVLSIDLPSHAQVRAGLLTVAGCPVAVLAYRATPLARPRVWVAAVPEVAR